MTNQTYTEQTYTEVEKNPRSTRKASSESRHLKTFLAGNEEAFVHVVNRYKKRLFTTIYLIVKNEEIAEDLLQETFIKVFLTIRNGKYVDRGMFGYWIQRIAFNLAIDHFRKSRKTPIWSSEDSQEVLNNFRLLGPSVEDEIVKHDTNRDLHRMLRQLPENQRQVLVMRHFMKMSFKDIAEELNISLNTALGRMRYALINLKKKFQEKKAIDEKTNHRRRYN
ncbi:MAG: RNA polymerase sigma factor [Cytophagales bacterium]|nr:RNA polymerase sigma factor [Cytophagales bacterium]